MLATMRGERTRARLARLQGAEAANALTQTLDKTGSRPRGIPEKSKSANHSGPCPDVEIGGPVPGDKPA